MLLRKESGGCTITHRGKMYTWKTDGAAIQVPVDLGEELLSIRGGGYSEASAEPEPAARAEVTEPAPAAKNAVTEPAPAKAAVAEGKPVK